jgi:leucyl aminopeptidase
MRVISVTYRAGAPLAGAPDLLVVPVLEGGLAGDPRFAEVDAALNGFPGRLAEREAFTGRFESELTLTPSITSHPSRITFLGAGKAGDLSLSRIQALAARAARLATPRTASATLVLPAEGADALAAAAVGLRLGAYAFDRYRTRDRDDPTPTAWTLTSAIDLPGATATLVRADVHASSVLGVRDLVNTPAADLTPRTFAEHARTAGLAAGLDVEVLDRNALATLGAGLLLAVGAGGTDGPYLVRLSWRPTGAVGAPIALVGKGVTFDAGGLHLKPRGGIDDMKGDMAGAATVLAVMLALPRLGVPVAVDGWLAVADNLVGSNAMRPGDVITSLSGRTVEVVDTDAEGRLVLADAITLAIRRGAGRVIDVATLTGACVVALGEHAAGVFTTDDALAGALLDAGARAGEDLWRLPMYEALRGQLHSDIADLKNVGERWGGATQGALFLSDFTDGHAHAHLDIAGPSFLKKEHALGPRGGTGFAARTLLEYLERASAV